MVLIPMLSSRPVVANAPTTSYSRLLKDNVISSAIPIDDTVSNLIMRSFCFSKLRIPRKHLSLTSLAGGSITAGLAIYGHDAVPEDTTSRRSAFGQAASMAAVLLAAGKKGNAFAFRIRRRDPSPLIMGEASAAGDRDRHPRQGHHADAKPDEPRSSPTTPDRAVDKIDRDTDRDYTCRRPTP